MTPPDPEQIREPFARYGLAMYHAQVLEHGIVNALVIVELIPTQRHRARSEAEWADTVDRFMGRQFEAPMGRMMGALRSATDVPPAVDVLLARALAERNRLAHDFFREHAETALTPAGRDAMIAELDASRALFKDADHALEEAVRPMREAAGITDAMMAEALREVGLSPEP